jgi:hypothetical protein
MITNIFEELSTRTRTRDRDAKCAAVRCDCVGKRSKNEAVADVEQRRLL